MKKLLLLLTGCVVAVSSNGQYAKHNTSGVFNNSGKVHNYSSSVAQNVAGLAHHSGARTTTTVFYTEDFGSGTHSSLPTGWTTGAITVGAWKWTNVASTSSYTMGAMMSTSAANGWMIFDSDSIGAATSGAPAGWLQSPAYNCSTHPYVRLNFEDFYRKYEDSCYIWVSTDPTFATHTVYPVLENNGIVTNATTPNPTTAHVDISATAGGHAAVYIRFVTYGPALGAYSWMIDDMTLSDLDSVDVGLEKSAIVYFPGSDVGFYSYGTIPSKMADTVFPESYVINYGFTAEPAVTVNARIFQGTSSVYTSNFTVNAPVDGYDSLADFTQATPSGYYSNTIAQYTVPFGVNPTGDAVTSNNVDTTTFGVTDSTWSENSPGKPITGSQYVHRPGTGVNLLSYSPATQFLIAAGQVDTLTSVSVAFGNDTKVGQVVGLQIFHYDGTNWTYDGLTQFRALTAADISAGELTTFANFAVDEVTSGGKIILNGSTGGVSYAAVLKGSGNTDTVSVLETDNPAVSSIINDNHTGLADTSDNAGGSSQQFGQGHLPFYIEQTPLINLEFGIIPVVVDHSGISNIANNTFVRKGYPNPANTTVSIPFTMNQDEVVTVTLSDVAGQVLKTQVINAIGGQSMKATIAVNDLADGVYLYCVAANGQHSNGRIVVAH